MTPTRRNLLASGTAALLLPGAARAARAAPKTLTAREGTAQLVPDGFAQTPIWGYDGGVPGPELRLKKGARLTRRFVNALPQSSTVHWHGIRIDNAMDGVAGLTQETVPPGDDFLYDFVVPDAGTYWYHPHDRTYEQAARGLYGALIVEEVKPPEVDRDLVLILDDWRLADDATIEETFGAMHDLSHGGRIGNWITVNGRSNHTQPVQRGERLRLRLINAANARIFTLRMQGVGGWTVALDGMPLETPEPLTRLTLAPAQRIDLIVDVTDASEALLVSLERGGDFALATFPVEGTARTTRLPDVDPLPPNPVPALGDLDNALVARVRMEGGAMGGMREAWLGDTKLPIRDLAAKGHVWAFNGIAGQMADDPLLYAQRGETVRIAMQNDTTWPHAMHLHGHHFRAVGDNGSPGPLRDTLLVARGETVQIAFVADNPGDWLLHCHMLEHAASGMMTRIVVT